MAGTVLVTGGSGYIGGYVIRQLVAEGWTVRATLRSPGREAEVRAALGVPGPELAFFAADLTSDTGWAEAMAGCSHVVHVASPIPSGRAKYHEDELIVPARDGTLRALRFAKAAGVKRFVQTSSIAAIVYGHADPDRLFTEADWSDVTAPGVSAYAKSKTIAERAARDWIAAEGGAMEYCTINPSLILGPVLGPDFTITIDIIKRLIGGGVPGYPRLGVAVVDVRDVADLHVRALTAPGMAGERFIAAGPFMAIRDVGAILRDRLGAQGRKVPTRNIPDFVLRVMALFDAALQEVVGELGRTRSASSAHALDRFGWKTRPAEDSIVDTARSLIDLGIVKV
ncbi:MAG: SDR family NAD(P)-dependent oxidoreductase [Pseudomonadota bacterium]|uniref:SDR family NAD(P)-dependent oxidoreductase n=1 Tax=Sphingomonas sp. ERG5 TaxID=1381597 RepID=UPI00054C76A6|nr:SDR family NAD(P)-dependent oxidoreductase [Sphingomonas sp. ERG5]